MFDGTIAENIARLDKVAESEKVVEAARKSHVSPSAMKAEGKSVLILAHRPAAIQECDLLLVLETGMRKGVGLRDQVLRELVKNHTEVKKVPAPGGAA